MLLTMMATAPPGYWKSMQTILEDPKADYNWDSLNGRRQLAKRGMGYMLAYPVFGVGIGYSLHAGQVIVADGTPEAAARLERVLTNDPAMGVFRHADAGYDEAIRCARELGADIPMSN